MVARLWYGLSVALCVFDLDHTLIQTPLDLAAMAVDMRALIEAASGPLPARHERYRVGELITYCRSQAPALESALWDLALDHSRRSRVRAAPGSRRRSGRTTRGYSPYPRSNASAWPATSTWSSRVTTCARS